MKKFYLPYNFVPVTGIISKKQQEQRPRARYDYTGEGQRADQQGAEPASAKAQARHDLWQAGRHSGTVTCQLRIISPTVVGNEHKGSSPTEVCQYTWQGQPAIPANSLRGMISSLAESLSQSALRVLHPDFHPAFANIEQDLVPWNEQRARNSGLTPAELLFGVVENNKEFSQDSRGEPLCSPSHTGQAQEPAPTTRGQEKHTHNLASRVRFYDAVLAAGEDPANVQDSLIVLRELSSPKPKGYQGEGEEKFKTDRPSLYFRDSQANPEISYDDLREYLDTPDPVNHPLPHGRKFYLLREKPGQLDRAIYEEQIKKGHDSQDKENKPQCKPIKPGTQFEFTVAFDNLSNAELTLLKTALMPAATTGAKFYHRLGLGKALGMGIVQVAMTGTEYINRKERYAVDGLLNGGGQITGEVVEDDPSLLDDQTLAQIRKAGSVEGLKPGIPVHWREGHRDEQKKAAPLPRLNHADKFLPDFYRLYDSGGAPKGPGGAKHEGGHYIVEVGEEETAAVQWLKEAISALNNNKPFEELPSDKINEGIVGPALSKHWDKIADNAMKAEVKELILSAATQRELDNYWKSGGSKRAKKKYDTWSV